jgi:hypothetical protein
LTTPPLAAIIGRFGATMARLTEATDVDLDPAAGMTVFEGSKKRPG